MSNTRWALRDADTYSTYQATEVIGEIYKDEEVEYLNQKVNGYAYIEYNTSSGRKRAWVYANNLGTSKPPVKIMKDPISPSLNYTYPNHKDYPVGKGTPVYAMCDGTFKFGYYWGKLKEDSSYSYISLGRGFRLTPDSGWQTADGRKASYIEYGHLSKLNGYSTPDYVERCPNSTYSNCVEANVKTLATKHVQCGELIGYSGNSGNTLGANGLHLHIRLK
ncbi:hypothetical protein AN1V17_35990 [Vallitalea sediminicola]